MLNYEQILELIDKLDGSSLTEVTIAQGDFSVSLKRKLQIIEKERNAHFAPGIMPIDSVPNPVGPSEAAQNVKTEDHGLIEITSPMVGTFYAAPSPESEAFVKIGQQIKPGEVVCIIEAMKMMNELPSEASGTVSEICVSNAQTVEYGQVLFKIKPSN